MLGCFTSWPELAEPLGGALIVPISPFVLCCMCYLPLYLPVTNLMFPKALKNLPKVFLIAFHMHREPFLHCYFRRSNPCSSKGVGDLPNRPLFFQLAVVFEPILSTSPIHLAKVIWRLTD